MMTLKFAWRDLGNPRDSNKIFGVLPLSAKAKTLWLVTSPSPHLFKVWCLSLY
jgi:hypothetical protein